MGAFSSWSYTSRITFWPTTTDELGQPLVGTPYTLNGTWTIGGPAQRNDSDVEFIPNATFWFEGELSQQPSRQWYVAVGEHTGPPPREAELIERVRAYDVSQFEAGSLIDFVAYT